MSTYQPAEGTVAARLIAALHEAGGSMTPAAASEALGVPANNIGPSAKAAVKAGLVCYLAGGRGKALWDDGDVVLAGIQINADAASVTLSDLQARRVHAFLERVYGPTA